MQEVESESIWIVLVKYALLFATIPIWGPFAKALWEEFVHAMRADGGLWGPEAGPIERRELEEEIAREEPRQVHELLAHHRARQARGRGSEEPAGVGAPGEDEPARRGGARPASPGRSPAARGFRS